MLIKKNILDLLNKNQLSSYVFTAINLTVKTYKFSITKEFKYGIHNLHYIIHNFLRTIFLTIARIKMYNNYIFRKKNNTKPTRFIYRQPSLIVLFFNL